MKSESRRDSTVRDCVVREIRSHPDARGVLTVVDESDLPFEVRRIFWVTDLRRGVSRGDHAHRSLREFIVCLHGALEVKLEDGVAVRSVTLTSADQGLLLVPYVWATQTSLADDTSYMVLASAPHDPADYIRSREEFVSLKGAHQ